jgi:hypothetical protein
MKNLKKLFAPAALAAFFAVMVGTSYAQTPGAAVSDEFTAYEGNSAVASQEVADYVVHLEWDGYVIHLEWSGVEANAASTVLSAAGTDAMFDQ